MRNCIFVFVIPDCPFTDLAINSLKRVSFFYQSHTKHDGMMKKKLQEIKIKITHEIYPKVVVLGEPDDFNVLPMDSSMTREWIKDINPELYKNCSECKFGNKTLKEFDVPILDNINQALEFVKQGKDFIYLPTIPFDIPSSDHE